MIRYSLRQLDYLVTCVDEGSLAKAALRLGVSQPTISAAIAKLEADLNVQLLLRHHAQGVSATATGKQVVQTARSLLRQANDLQRSAYLSADFGVGDLHLGSFITLAPAYVPMLAALVRTQCPGLNLILHEATQDQLVKRLREGHDEIALMYNIDLPDDLKSSVLAQFQPYVLLSSSHPLSNDECVDLRDLAQTPFILLDVEPSRHYFRKILQTAGVEPVVAFSSSSLEMVRGLVGQGLGYSILVTRPSGDMSYDGKAVLCKTIKGTPRPSEVVLASLQNLRPTRAMIQFEQLSKDIFSKY